MSRSLMVDNKEKRTLQLQDGAPPIVVGRADFPGHPLTISREHLILWCTRGVIFATVGSSRNQNTVCRATDEAGADRQQTLAYFRPASARGSAIFVLAPGYTVFVTTVDGHDPKRAKINLLDGSAFTATDAADVAMRLRTLELHSQHMAGVKLLPEEALAVQRYAQARRSLSSVNPVLLGFQMLGADDSYAHQRHFSSELMQPPPLQINTAKCVEGRHMGREGCDRTRARGFGRTGRV